MRTLLVYAVLTAVLAAVLGTSQRGAGVFSGQLLSIDGTPLAGVRVAAVDPSDPTTMVSLAQTDRDGRYRLEDVPAGSYHILATQRESESYYPGVGQRSEARVVSVTAGATVSGLDFKFIASSGILRAVRAPSTVPGHFFGTIRDTKGDPLPNMTILVSDPQTGARFMTSTNAAGAFDFKGLPATTLSMEILSPVQSGYLKGGYEQLKDSIVLKPGESLQQDIRLRLVVSSSAQQRPDLYVRPASRIPGLRVESAAGLRGPSPQYAPVPYPPGVTPSARPEDDAVVLQILVGTDGMVLWLRAMSPISNPELVRAAIEAAGRWEFTPLITNRGPMQQSGSITINFVRNN